MQSAENHGTVYRPSVARFRDSSTFKQANYSNIRDILLISPIFGTLSSRAIHNIPKMLSYLSLFSSEPRLNFALSRNVATLKKALFWQNKGIGY